MTSHITCNGLFKNESLYGMGFRIPSSSLHYTTQTTMQPLYSTAFHCTVSPLLHCDHYSTAPHCYNPTTPLNFIELLPLDCTPTVLRHFTARYTLHCISLSGAVQIYTLRFPTRCSAQHCTAFYSTSPALHSVAFYCTVQWSTLHFTRTSLHSSSLHGAVRFTILHPTIMYFTAHHSLPREGAQMHPPAQWSWH